MEGHWIYPSTINCNDEDDPKWIALCKALGYDTPRLSIFISPSLNTKKIKKEIPLYDYVLLNRKGFACSKSWKHRLIKMELMQGIKAPFDFVIKNDRAYVIIQT